MAGARQSMACGRLGKQDGLRVHKAYRLHWRDWISSEMQWEDTEGLYAME